MYVESKWKIQEDYVPQKYPFQGMMWSGGVLFTVEQCLKKIASLDQKEWFFRTLKNFERVFPCFDESATTILERFKLD
ncbi:hypothetical protein [Holospora curviuscula]|uniref:Uncharacterized protein n=1 Tax=Holospora curviuscula TaxID=1082868 RepID=A0A2S5R955_9PROT|nr:hypothetical protein [Holospora curviuscula]PPE03859.1 hypothetical protein HCUR_00637 [Holospora curviuscula]